ncbi:MAG: hypothetical protein K2Q45_02520 [Nitrosomonas sp.]|nr:hypothetical protein [Nitrosomonas sp.]
MTDVRLNIGATKKYAASSGSSGAGGGLGASAKRSLRSSTALLHSRIQERDATDHENDLESAHVFHVDSPREKLHVCNVCGNGSGSSKIVLIFILFFCILVWLIILTCLHVFAATAAPPNGAPAAAVAPVLDVARNTAKYEVPFVLQPDANSNNRIMTLTNLALSFERIIRYDVCCTLQAYFVCRSVMKNIGIEAYVTTDKTAVVTIIHNDMIGAKCMFMWTERS